MPPPTAGGRRQPPHADSLLALPPAAPLRRQPPHFSFSSPVLVALSPSPRRPATSAVCAVVRVGGSSDLAQADVIRVGGYSEFGIWMEVSGSFCGLASWEGGGGGAVSSLLGTPLAIPSIYDTAAIMAPPPTPEAAPNSEAAPARRGRRTRPPRAVFSVAGWTWPARGLQRGPCCAEMRCVVPREDASGGGE